MANGERLAPALASKINRENATMTASRRWVLCFGMAMLAFAMLGSMAAQAQDATEGQWTPLFNGKNLDGWIQRGGEAKYSVEDGVILGQSVPNTQNSFLCTPRDYGDFILELDFKVDEGLNSGVQIRSQCFDEEKTVELADGKTRKIPAGRVHGYQVEIDPSPRSYSGGVYDEARRGWLFDLKDNEAARKAFKPGEWNHFRIECKGDSIKTLPQRHPGRRPEGRHDALRLDRASGARRGPARGAAGSSLARREDQGIEIIL